MIGLALEGGGAKGSYQAGAYMALKKCHIKIDAVVGSSIGSFNGALIASHDEDKMINIWKDTTMNDILGIDDEKAGKILKGDFSLDNIKWSFTELYRIFKNKGLDISNYRALIRNNIDEEKLRNSNIKYGLTTIRLNPLKLEEPFIEDIPNGELHDYIVASSYLPVFKRQKLMNNSYYLDGGLYNLCPTDMLERIGCDKIYVINIKGIGHRIKNNTSKAEIIEIKPKVSLGSILLFNKDSNEANITYGYNDTLRLFGKLDGNDYYFTKRSNFYYKRVNHRIDKKRYKIVSALLNSKNKKETVIKALEYILKKEKKSDLKTYNPNRVIKSIKNIDKNDIIYNYVRDLSIL